MKRYKWHLRLLNSLHDEGPPKWGLHLMEKTLNLKVTPEGVAPENNGSTPAAVSNFFPDSDCPCGHPKSDHDEEGFCSYGCECNGWKSILTDEPLPKSEEPLGKPTEETK